MALTEDQLQQASRLHNGVAWVYPSTDDMAFWEQYFNGTPTRTEAEAASGITVGGGAGPEYYAPRAQAPAPAPQPQVLPGIGGGFPLGSGRLPANWSVPSVPTGMPAVQQVGGTGQWMAGASGDGLYNSALIKALRQSSAQQFANQAGGPPQGVTMMPNAAQAPGAPIGMMPGPTGLANNPPVLQMPTLSDEELQALLTRNQQKKDDAYAALTPAQPVYSDGGLTGGGN
jgi:hypothetical protein